MTPMFLGIPIGPGEMRELHECFEGENGKTQRRWKGTILGTIVTD